MATGTVNLLSSKEKITNNLGSNQIVKILNALINATAEPLFKHSNLMRQLILQALLQTQIDHRRKNSIHSKQLTASCIVYGVINNNYSSIKMCELDRDILLKSILYLQPYLEKSLIIEKKLIKKPNSTKIKLKQQQLGKFTGIKPELLTPLAKWVMPYLDLYLEFKNRIIHKYIKFAYQEANRSKANTNLIVDIQDLNKNYELAVSKAIDKFDANKGTLTSYIMQWMLSARSAPEYDHQYGVSYKIPANVRKEYEKKGITLTNMSSEISEKHLEIVDEDMSEKMRHLAGGDRLFLKCLREIPDINYVYMILDIPIELNNDEISNLKGLAKT